MMPRLDKTVVIIAVVILTLGGALAQDGEETVPYQRTRGFNVPILEGWENRSGPDYSEFGHAEAIALIRTALVSATDAVDAAGHEMNHMTGNIPTEPIYSGKVNLADGTWTVLAYDIIGDTTASVMTRRAGDKFVVISLVENNPDTRTVLLTQAQADDSLDEATPEIARALEDIAGVNLEQLEATESLVLPSGEWQAYERDDMRVMGMVFGNESYLALQEGEPGDLAALADAWNRTLLGFFITPDNSLYLVLGLAVTFAILGTLVLSHFWRFRSLQKDLTLLNELGKAADT
jgi:hypothetical protein